MERIQEQKMPLEYYLENYTKLKIEGLNLSIIDTQDYILEDFTAILIEAGYEVFWGSTPAEKEILVEKHGDDAFFIDDIYIIGSRIHGTNREDSDLDVLIEFDGNFREDDLFTFLTETPIELYGINVDINPVTKDKSGTALQWLENNF